MSRRNPRYNNGHRRRQLRERLLATVTICEVCGEPLDKNLPPHHALAPEVDERVPVSAGGNPLDRGGTRLIHRRCNRAEWRRWRWGTPRSVAPLATGRNW